MQNNNQPPYQTPYYPYPPSDQPPPQYPSMGPSPTYPPIPQGPYGGSQPQDPYAQWPYPPQAPPPNSYYGGNNYPPAPPPPQNNYYGGNNAPPPPQNNYYGGNNYYGYPPSGPTPPGPPAPSPAQNQPQGQYWDGGYQNQNSWRPDQYNIPFPLNPAQPQQFSQPNNNVDNSSYKVNLLMGLSNDSSPPPLPIINRPVQPEPPIIYKDQVPIIVKPNVEPFNLTKDQTIPPFPQPTPSFDSAELKHKVDLLLNFDSDPIPPQPNINIEFKPQPNIIPHPIHDIKPNPRPIFDLNPNPKPDFLQNYDQNRVGVIDESTLFDIDLNEGELAKVKNILETEKVFVDHTFPAEEKSLLDLPNSEKKYEWTGLSWKRPEEFFKTDNYEVFQSTNDLMKSMMKTSSSKREIESGDILQGIIGDCYFLSSISSLAESSPARILKLFLTKKKTKTGLYCVRLCLEGEWKIVYVDSLIPCFTNGGPCFTKSQHNQNEIWVLILEKAYAKAFTNYERIEAGLSREALRELTGASINVLFNDDTKLWDRIFEGTQKNYVMTAGSKEEDDLSVSKVNKGIYASHAYSLLGAFEIMGQKIVKMRNPWGEKEWKGRWSDQSAEWSSVSESEKKRLGYNPCNDGIFFMSFEDFKNSYSDFQICMIHDDFKYSSIKVEESIPKKGHYLKMRVKTSGAYFLTVLQLSKRIANRPDFQHSLSKIVVGKIEGNGMKYKGGKQLIHRDNWIETELEAGDYVVYAKVEVSSKNKGAFTLSSYGKDKVHFEKASKLSNFFNDIMTDKALNSKKSNYSKIGRPEIEKSIEAAPKEGFGHMFFINNGAKDFKTTLKFKNIDGLRFQKPIDRWTATLNVNLKGGEKQIFVVRVSHHGFGLNYEESISG